MTTAELAVRWKEAEIRLAGDHAVHGLASGVVNDQGQLDVQFLRQATGEVHGEATNLARGCIAIRQDRIDEVTNDLDRLQCILPVVLPNGVSARSLHIQPGDMVEVLAPAETLTPRAVVPVRVLRSDGSVVDIAARAGVETQLEVDLLKAGGMIPTILARMTSS